jgi:CTP synthase
MKYIFVTGGVVSSLGKGLTAAALGTLLERRGLKVVLQKFDPYLNLDPGTMSPYQHGEVYVLEDGAETDLDLGHYERFTSGRLTRANNVTSGQIYELVLSKERSGEYLGKTVQVIPHVTEEIKARIRALGTRHPCDIIITEIGGTTGDIEGLPFLEAIRQFSLEVGPHNTLFIHVTLVPYLKAAGELKTKPTQQSIAKLREIGIQPHILICRTEHPLPVDVRQKLSMFCNVPLDSVIEEKDVAHTIYEVPLMLQKEKVDSLVCRYLQITTPSPSMESWSRFVQQVIFPSRKIRIAVVGKYIEHKDAYKSVYESLTHAAAACDTGVELLQVDAEMIEREGAAVFLSKADGILVPGGFGDRGTQGKIAAAHYARIKGIPYLGLCLGMQIAVIEFARNMLGLTEANSTEFNAETPHPVICLLDEQKSVTKMGGTMRLGTCPCRIVPGSRAHAAYGCEETLERHRHRYEFNAAYREEFDKCGLLVSGTSPDGALAEIIELRDHPWFVACQFHPEFQSKPTQPHPLFHGFLGAVLQKAGTA